MAYLLNLQSALTETTTLIKLSLPKQQQMNKTKVTKLNPPDTQHQLLCIN